MRREPLGGIFCKHEVLSHGEQRPITAVVVFRIAGPERLMSKVPQQKPHEDGDE
jgi:hypothetical protein